MKSNLKENEMNIKAIRHGEVLLMPVENIKGEFKKHTSFIVGHSETGHHHVLESKTEFEVAELDRAMLVIRLFAPADLVHKKTVNAHKTLTVPAGTYKVVHKQEYDPFEKVMREVWD